MSHQSTEQLDEGWFSVSHAHCPHWQKAPRAKVWGSRGDGEKGSCCSVTQLCPTLCNPMDCSMPGFPVLHYLLEFAQTPEQYEMGRRADS